VVTSSFGVKLLLIAEEQFDIGRLIMLIVYVIVLWMEFVSFEQLLLNLMTVLFLCFGCKSFMQLLCFAVHFSIIFTSG
jgi:hypothetical protein